MKNNLFKAMDMGLGKLFHGRKYNEAKSRNKKRGLNLVSESITVDKWFEISYGFTGHEESLIHRLRLLKQYLDGSLRGHDALNLIAEEGTVAIIGEFFLELFTLVTQFSEVHDQVLDLCSTIYGDEKLVEMRDAFASKVPEWDEIMLHMFSVLQHERDPNIRMWRNFHLFSARLVRAERIPTNIALRHISMATEKGAWIKTDAQMDLTRVTAAYYLIQASPLVYSNPPRKEDGSQDGSWGMSGAGAVWKGSEGLSEERWQMWKDRLDEFIKMEGVMGSTAALAKKAPNVDGLPERSFPDVKGLMEEARREMDAVIGQVGEKW